MLPDCPNPLNGANPCLDSFAGADSPETAARILLGLMAGRTGAVETRIRLRCKDQRIDACWSAGEGIRTAPGDPWQGFLDPVLERTLAEGKTVTTCGRVGDRELVWVSLPVAGSSKCYGMVSGGFDKEAADAAERLLPWAAALAVKLDAMVYRRQAVAERGRSASWFKTMDVQLRILERERQKLSAVVNKTDAAVFVAKTDGEFIWVNPALASWYGTDENPSHLLGRACRMICGHDTECEDCPVHLIRDGAPIVHQERRETRNGEARTLYVSAFPVRTPEGRVDEVMVMLQDLTDLETLRRSEARYHLLFERSTDAIVMADPQSLDIVMANRQARNLLGLRLDNGAPHNLLSLHPESARGVMRERYRRLALGRPLENVEVEVVARNEDTLTCNACGALFDLDGADVILVEFRDVTQVRKLQAELARADHLITLGTMNAGIAHEFKNRLAPLRAFAQMIGMRATDQEKLKAYSPMIISEIDRLTALVKDILDYARPQVPDLKRLDLVGLAAGMAAEFSREFRHRFREKNITCNVRVPEDESCPILVDPDQVRQVFLNLFKNSLEACEGCGGGGRIQVQAYRWENIAVVRLEDTGCGMDEATLTRVFDPFFSTKGPLGTGLGMCIVKSLVEANRGAIHVESHPGEGTAIELRFPIENAALEPGTPAEEAA